MGERSGLTEDCTTGESRDVAVAEAARRAGGARAGGGRDRDAGRARAGRRPAGRLAAVHEAAAAVLMAWLPGRAAARPRSPTRWSAQVSPGGKLPISYPRSSGQIPVFYGHKVSGGRSHWKGEYVDVSNEPLYPFGHGLVVLDVRAGDGRRPWRRGARSGDVVDVSAIRHQPWATDGPTRWCSSTAGTRWRRSPAPCSELPGLRPGHARPGPSRRGSPSRCRSTALGFTGRDLAYVVEPGDIEFFVGTSADDVRPAGRVVVAGDGPHVVTRAMASTARVEPA